jgi:hypothetical protein
MMTEPPQDRKLHAYWAICREPSTGKTATFNIRAFTPGNADVQARDGFYGLLGVDEEKRASLEVVLEDRGVVEK